MFTGAWCAIVTPFRQSGAIDFAQFENLIMRQIEGGMDGIVIGGTTGESPTLEESELMALVDLGVKLGRGRIQIMAGTGSYSTRKSVRLTQMAKDLGAHGALVIVPYYNKPTDRGVILHFEELAKVKLPLMVYHHPGRTGICLQSETLANLCKIDYVVGIKEATGKPGFTKEILSKNPEACILSGDDELAIEIIHYGGKGSVSIIANLYPDLWKQIIDLAMAGRENEARALYGEIEALLKAILQEVNPQGIKCALSHQGLIEEVFRLPLVPVLEKTREAISHELQREHMVLLTHL